jgi:O-antigen/teichoic acid export membrane protein
LLLLVSTGLAIGFITCSHLFVSVVLGPKYAMTGWMLQLLGVRGAIELFTSVTASMLFALGSSKFAAIGNVFKLVFLAIGLTVAFGRFGFREALWVLTLAPLANYAPLLFGLNRYCKPALRTELASFGAFATSTILVAFLFRIFLHS